VQVADLMRVEPTNELLEAVPSVGEDFVFRASVFFEQTNIKLGFSNINTERGSG
jgi:hypothetical protein